MLKRPSALACRSAVFAVDRDTPAMAAILSSGMAHCAWRATSVAIVARTAHSAIVNRLLWMQDEYHLAPADTVLQKTPATFDVSVWEFFWPLQVGAKLVVAEPDGHRDPVYLSKIIAAEHITTAHFVPSMLAVFASGARAADCV